jgi:hypothetical protein
LIIGKDKEKQMKSSIDGCNACFIGSSTLEYPYSAIWNAIFPELKNKINEISGKCVCDLALADIQMLHLIPEDAVPMTAVLSWSIDDIVKGNYNKHGIENIKPHASVLESPVIVSTMRQCTDYGFVLTWWTAKTDGQ